MFRRVLLFALLLPAASAGAEPQPESAPDALATAIDGAVAFLLESQNKDGSWGTPAPNLNDIYAPVPGSQQAFHVAATALALSGLIGTGIKTDEVEIAIGRARDWLVEHHAVRRVSPNTLYNTWAHAYALEAFARLLACEKDADRKATLLAASAVAVQRLVTFEFVEGGWGYYDFSVKAKDPGPGATSFSTATVLHAFRLAADQGVEIPDRLVRRALGVIRISRKPDNSYAYSVRHRFYPQGPVNKIKGSLARSPACLLAVLDWSDRDAELAKAKTGSVKAFEDLETHGHFLRIARKYPIPHETWYQNSGYFCFYGYYYASELLSEVSDDHQRRFADQLQGHLVGLQEKDGSFWDYQLFNFHKAYGTGYVLMALARCKAVRDAAEAPKDG